jgi:hypothetical protein
MIQLLFELPGRGLFNGPIPPHYRQGIALARPQRDNSYIMSKSKPTATMSEVLRRAIVESGQTYLELNRATGLTRASLQRFVERRNSLRLDLADRLAQYLGLSLVSNGNRSTGKRRT